MGFLPLEKGSLSKSMDDAYFEINFYYYYRGQLTVRSFETFRKGIEFFFSTSVTDQLYLTQDQYREAFIAASYMEMTDLVGLPSSFYVYGIHISPIPANGLPNTPPIRPSGVPYYPALYKEQIYASGLMPAQIFAQQAPRRIVIPIPNSDGSNTGPTTKLTPQHNNSGSIYNSNHYCNECGYENPKDASYCINCAAKI